jgi:hypothetical protein
MPDNAQSSHLIRPTSSGDRSNHCAGEIRAFAQVASVDNEIE